MKSIFEFLEISAKKYPTKNALIEGVNTISYKELLKKSQQVSENITNRIDAGQSISLLSENSIEFVIIYFGILMSGNIAHIIPINSSEKQILYQIQQVKPCAIFCSELMQKKISRIKYKYEIISNIIENSKHLEFNYELKRFNDISSIIFTSGTTGIPKGVKLKHQNIIFTTKNIIDIVGIKSEDIEINPLQLSHSFGLGCLHTSIAQSATTIIFKNTINLKIIIDSIEKQKATGFVGVPTTFQNILDNYKENFKEKGKKLRYMLTNSAPMLEKDVKEIMNILPSTKIFTYYGLTEASRSTFLLFNSNLDKIESVGTPVHQVKIKIVGKECKQLENFQLGEIWIKGPNVIENYLDNERSKLRDGWLQTGDLGYLDNEGYLYIKGRKDEIINVGGEKVAPIEIETAIRQIEEVQDVGVIGVTNRTFGEIPVAYIVTKSEIKEQEIVNHCNKMLERYKIPQEIIFTEKIPKNESGKIKRDILKDRYKKE
jgi:long-chain acyl-CoA synthetase